MDLFGKQDSGQNAKGFSLGKPQKQAPAFNPQEFEGDINDLARKLRINEERTMDLRKKSQMIEHNMLSSHKKLLTEIRYLNDELSNLKREFQDLKDAFGSLSRESQQKARKEDSQVLERYINIWQPVNFVTRQEVERVIDEKLRKV